MSNRIVSLEIRGLREATEALRKMGQDISEGVRQSLDAAGLEVLTTVREAIKHGPKTGREYRRGKKFHRASAPGEAPASDMGALANSIYYTHVDEHTVAIGSRLEYAFILEFGSRNGKIAKRPAWIPAAEKASPRLKKRIERVIREATARAQKGAA